MLLTPRLAWFQSINLHLSDKAKVNSPVRLILLCLTQLIAFAIPMFHREKCYY